MTPANVIPLNQDSTPAQSKQKQAWAWALKVGSSSIKSILIALTERANKSLVAYPSIACLCDMTELNRKTVIAGLSALVEMGLIEDTGIRAGSTHQIIAYRIMVGNSPKNVTIKNRSNSTKNGTVPETEQFQNFHETVPFFPDNSTVFSVKQSQKRDTESLGTLKEPLKEPLNKAHIADASAERVENQTELAKVKKPKEAPIPAPENINPTAWAEFEVHRASIKKPLTNLARKKLFEVLGKHSPAVQQAMVDNSIRNNWVGVFELSKPEMHKIEQAQVLSKHSDFAKRDYTKGAVSFNDDGSFNF